MNWWTGYQKKNWIIRKQQKERVMMEFEYCHKEEILLIMEHAQGSCYENFKEIMQQKMEGYFFRYFERMLGKPPDQNLIRILAGTRIESSLEILKGDYSMEYTLYLADAIGYYATAGAEKLINKIKRCSSRLKSMDIFFLQHNKI